MSAFHVLTSTTNFGLKWNEEARTQDIGKQIERSSRIFERTGKWENQGQRRVWIMKVEERIENDKIGFRIERGGS